MRFFSILFVSLFFAAAAHADCALVQDNFDEIRVDNIFLPLYDAMDMPVKGCLVQSNGKVVGYSTDEGLCKTPLGTMVKIRLTYGCCDTGLDSGGTECVVRSKSPLGVESAHGNGVILHPTSPAFAKPSS
ncbi:MAG: hypothetical protein EB060_07245 [Proteobacteria bacterium]|nr:hypothetical protein [Pseudomonadota bacterium]